MTHNESFVQRKLEEHDKIKNNIIEGLQKSLTHKDGEITQLKK